jgi:hypothetical protein
MMVRFRQVLIPGLAAIAGALALPAAAASASPTFRAPLTPSPAVTSGVVSGHLTRVGARRIDLRLVLTMRVVRRFRFAATVLANREPRDATLDTLGYDHEDQHAENIRHWVKPGTGRHVVIQRPIQWWAPSYSARLHRDVSACCQKLTDVVLDAEDESAPKWPYGTRYLLADMGLHPTLGLWYFDPTGQRICLPYGQLPTAASPFVCAGPLT